MRRRYTGYLVFTVEREGTIEKKRNILVVGSGGREHALAWKLAQSPLTARIFVAPGNGGTEWPAYLARGGGGARAGAESVPVDSGDVAEIEGLIQKREIDLTLIGPEAPLAAGLVDRLQAQGHRVFGPTQAAARLETSKAFAKRFMREHAIPTGDFAVFDSYEAARSYVDGHPWPDGLVVKASGLAAGKGVFVCDTAAEAQDALARLMRDATFGAAGAEVLVEERLTGPELSLLAFCDGRHVAPLLPARDHKRAYDGDAGPNTGGMGAIAPVPGLPAGLVDELVRRVLQPTVDGLAAAGTPYVGVLYAGLMLTAEGPKVLEFNCRFGDPETQVLLPLLATDLVEVVEACIDGRLDAVTVAHHSGAAAAVVMAAPGYPGHYPKGASIGGIMMAEAREGVVVFQAGTAVARRDLVTAGGRVLAVSARGVDVAAALDLAYAALGDIDFEGAHFRRDIGRTEGS